jgi:hypothetical protein
MSELQLFAYSELIYSHAKPNAQPLYIAYRRTIAAAFQYVSGCTRPNLGRIWVAAINDFPQHFLPVSSTSVRVTITLTTIKDIITKIPAMARITLLKG